MWRIFQRKEKTNGGMEVRMVVVLGFEPKIQEPNSCVIPISPYHSIQGYEIATP